MSDPIVDFDEAKILAEMKIAESNMARCYLKALAVIEAASFYINASDRELADAGVTRQEALRKFHELHGPIYLAFERD